MSALSPKTRDLIARGRGGPPSAADRVRVRAKLDERLAMVAAAGVATAGAVAGAAKAASAGTASIGTASIGTASIGTASVGTASVGTALPATGAGTAVVVAQTGTFGLSLKIGLAVLVLGAAGISYQAIRAHHAEPAIASPSGASQIVDAPSGFQPTEKTLPTEEPSSVAKEDGVSATDKATPEPSPSSSAVPSSSARLPKGRDPASIAGEVLLLRRAQSALASGDPNASLRAIDAIETSHPSGALREETSAARVLALCAAGKKADAKAEAARFLAQWPSSVQAARVRGSCAFAPDGASN